MCRIDYKEIIQKDQLKPKVFWGEKKLILFNDWFVRLNGKISRGNQKFCLGHK